MSSDIFLICVDFEDSHPGIVIETVTNHDEYKAIVMRNPYNNKHSVKRLDGSSDIYSLLEEAHREVSDDDNQSD